MAETRNVTGRSGLLVGHPKMAFLLAVLVGLLLFVPLAGCSTGSGERNGNGRTNQERRQSGLDEQVMLSGQPLCMQGCVGLAIWNQLIPDGWLRGAAIVAYTYNPDWRPLARNAALRGTRVEWGNLPSDVGGTYDSNQNVITIANSLRSEFTPVLAAVLSHEIAHVSQPAARTPAMCIENEGSAYSWEAATWSSVPHSNEGSAMAQGQDAIENAWRASRLRAFVLGLPLYQRSCLGVDLPKD